MSKTCSHLDSIAKVPSELDRLKGDFAVATEDGDLGAAVCRHQRGCRRMPRTASCFEDPRSPLFHATALKIVSLAFPFILSTFPSPVGHSVNVSR